MDKDTRQTPVLNKLDALMQKHRGGPSQSGIPVLTELEIATQHDDIPVLSNVVLADAQDDFVDLLFSTEEILGETPQSPPASQPVADTPVAPPSPSRLIETVQPVAEQSFESLIEVPALSGRESAQTSTHHQPSALLPEIAFDLIEDDAVTALEPQVHAQSYGGSVVPPVPAPAPVPEAQDLIVEFDDHTRPLVTPETRSAAGPETIFSFEPLDIMLDDPFAAGDSHPQVEEDVLHIELTPVAAPAPEPVIPIRESVSALNAATPALRSIVAAQLESPTPAPTTSPEPATEPVELASADALCAALMDEIKPEMHRLVRTELSKQIAVIHQQAVKSVTQAILPELEKLIAAHIADALAALQDTSRN
ncbi:hypothetical protein KSF73_05850 [Burkholderiaceae bacterium DAT-1]|nr:hypothetical protein [Burkholderiaceae bacterium DAT-1]